MNLRFLARVAPARNGSVGGEYAKDRPDTHNTTFDTSMLPAQINSSLDIAVLDEGVVMLTLNIPSRNRISSSQAQPNPTNDDEDCHTVSCSKKSRVK